MDRVALLSSADPASETEAHCSASAEKRALAAAAKMCSMLAPKAVCDAKPQCQWKGSDQDPPCGVSPAFEKLLKEIKAKCNAIKKAAPCDADEQCGWKVHRSPYQCDVDPNAVASGLLCGPDKHVIFYRPDKNSWSAGLRLGLWGAMSTSYGDEEVNELSGDSCNELWLRKSTRYGG